MFKRILKTILNVILFLCLVILSYLTIIRGLFLETANAQTVASFDITKIQDLSKEDIHASLDGIFEEYNIPTKVIDEVLATNEHEAIIDEYVEEAKSAIKNGQNLPEVPKDDIENLLIKGIETYNKKYNANISITKIKELVEEFADQMDKIIQIVDQNKAILESFQIVLNDQLYYGLLIFTGILIIIITILLKKEALFSLGGVSIFNGLIMFISYLIFKNESLKEILSYITFDPSLAENNFLFGFLVFSGTGLLLLIMYRYLIYREQKRKENN